MRCLKQWMRSARVKFSTFYVLKNVKKSRKLDKKQKNYTIIVVIIMERNLYNNLIEWKNKAY